MSVRLSHDGRIELYGVCAVEDAEILLQHLLADPGALVDWRQCSAAHSAVVQVIACAGVVPVGPPMGQILIDVVEPLLKQR